MDILNVSEKAIFDNTLVNVEKHSHLPYISNSFKNNDEIRIPIQQTDIYTLPYNSFIYIEGKLLKDNGQVSATAKFVNNFFAHLFEEFRYEIGGKVVDRVKNPGIATTLKAYVSLNQNESKRLMNAGWNTENADCVVEVNDTTTGHFNLCVPLRLLFGFAEDFRKIVINLRQELVLIRSNSDHNAIINSVTTETNKVEIEKIMWKMPHISVADAERLKLLSLLEQGSELEIGFRNWELYEYPLLQNTQSHTWTVKSATQLEKPRYVIIGFQTNRKNKLSVNSSKFDHCNLTNIKLYLNSEIFPYDNLNLNFDKNQYSILYEMYSNFQQSYYERENEPLFNPKSFKDTAPLVVIDCSRQNEILNYGSVDIRLEFETNKDIPSSTSAYCLILHDTIVKYTPLTGNIRTM